MPRKRSTHRQAVTRRLTRRVPTQSGRGFTTVPAGTEEATLEVTVDWDRLVAWLKSRALVSKHGKATAQGGSIVAKVTHRRRIEACAYPGDVHGEHDHDACADAGLGGGDVSEYERVQRRRAASGS